MTQMKQSLRVQTRRSAKARSVRLWAATGVCALLSICSMFLTRVAGVSYTVVNWVGVIAMLAAGVLAGFALLGDQTLAIRSPARRRRLGVAGVTAVVVGVAIQFLGNVLILNGAEVPAVWSLLAEASGGAVIVVGAVFLAAVVAGSSE